MKRLIFAIAVAFAVLIVASAGLAQKKANRHQSWKIDRRQKHYGVGRCCDLD